MAKITFMGAGSTVFVKNIIGDSMLTPSLQDAHIALYDIDGTRLRESKKMLDILNKNINKGRAKITAHLGVANRKAALKGSNYVVNAIQVGGYEPSTVIDFEIPKKYGLRQTIADTTGIGGIFRALRTVPVMLDFARDMESVCPDAWMLNYTNPMPTISTALLRGSNIKYVGLCHSVQVCASGLLSELGLSKKYPMEEVQHHIAGINHMAWLLEITHKGKDIYPEIKKAAKQKIDEIMKKGGAKAVVDAAKAKYGEEASKKEPLWGVCHDMVRLYLMLNFGHYITESSEHNAEYHPYFIKDKYPEFIDQFNIPLDEYPRRCINQIAQWKKQSREMINSKLGHTRGHEYGSYIMEAMETNTPARIGASVMNTGLIPNLPSNMAVEVPCMVDRNGVQGCYVGNLPEQCAALNRTNVNTHLLTVEAILTGKKESIYHAAMLDPHTKSELSIDAIRSMCDDLIKAHGNMLPKYK